MLFSFLAILQDPYLHLLNYTPFSFLVWSITLKILSERKWKKWTDLKLEIKINDNKNCGRLLLMLCDDLVLINNRQATFSLAVSNSNIAIVFFLIPKRCSIVRTLTKIHRWNKMIIITWYVSVSVIRNLCMYKLMIKVLLN